MPKTVTRVVILLLVLLAAAGWLLARQDAAGWRWLVNGGWHTTARMGKLNTEEQRWATIAWRYFENNSQAGSGLVNGEDKRPVASLWQMGDVLIALTAARQLNLIDDAAFDQRLTLLLGTLNQMPLTPAKLPNLLYNTQTVKMVGYGNTPQVIGWSSRDIARLLMALRIVAAFHPEYSEYLERTLLRWDFCRLVDDKGQLYSGQMQDKKLITRAEGRLGDSEYSAAGFGLWGFANQQSLRPPAQHVIINGLALDIDARDPRTTWTPSAITTTPYALSGIEYGWELPGADRDVINLLRQRASNVYRVQEMRWEKEKILTARSDFSISAPPWHVNDTIFANGYAWNTLSDEGKWVPRLAQVSTRAVFGLWTLWDTPFTDALMKMTRLQNDPARGWFEGRVEATGSYNRAITLSTNAMVLEALFFKSNMGPLLRHGEISAQSYFRRQLDDPFTAPQRCFPVVASTADAAD
ncbi:DUF3131 domain-containing protein [Erwinia phyllosphaerae]|uniref:DUF3131 domain-containing protein n=1 Tax=Erwinia phyllosphaerae TaxID=2853256 RepID=UPI001FED514B|nr:DUF3131 domain-containing protein [Erwinia phyllosphaerae]MBV4365772.1 DUF3131 domain-containing protein [Erwinia phyllosphaerae]